MRVTGIRGVNFILKCSYEDRYDAQRIGAKWSLGLRCFILSATLSNYEILKNEPSVEFYEPVDEYMQEKLDNAISFKDKGYRPKTISYDHQKKLTNLVLDEERCFFLCGMGTGKTKAVLDAISHLHYKEEVERCLVVTPSSIMQNFNDEIEKHSFLESTLIRGKLSERKKKLKISTPIHIINYEILTKLHKEISAVGFDMIVFDECHRLKNRQSKCSKAAYKISKGVRFRVGLTGTMLSNSYEDVFMPFKAITPRVFGETFNYFKSRFLEYGGYQNYQIVGYKNKDLFMELLSTVSLKYELDDITDLPPEIEIIKKIDLTDKNQKIYQTLYLDSLIETKDSVRLTANILEKMLRLSQVTSGFTLTESGGLVDVGCEKLNLLEETLEEISGKVIIWCRFTHSIERVAELCRIMKFSYMTYYGKTKDKGLYKKYNEGDTKVWIAQLQTGIGYSIPTAKYAIFYETDYSRVNHVQSKGRNRRLTGSEQGSCVYIYLHVKDSLDEIIFETLKKKNFDSEEALKYVKGG